MEETGANARVILGDLALQSDKQTAANQALHSAIIEIRSLRQDLADQVDAEARARSLQVIALFEENLVTLRESTATEVRRCQDLS